MLSAAFFLVRRSLQDAVNITERVIKTDNRRKVQPLSLSEKVEARIELHGGKATSSQGLPYVNATAAEVKALAGIEVTTEKGKTGRPSTVFRIRGEHSCDSASDPAGAERERGHARGVRLDAPTRINVARAQLDIGDRDGALENLTLAWDVAPQMARIHPMGREVFRVVSSLHRRSNPELVRLSKLSGISL
ncbi:hypothetical protein ACTPOK_20760 [Streptomyces inhibens]|uniref:hypothetical protein n=1 Tax=Streptomyces inhibens TaxID=2293571 RepID=UPI00402A80A8